ncbi:MAG: hypothetical protein HY761_11230 [Candidatus Omnitrophica bacterium]|nr:hypothetical protein [Candidatus Omnitrophota bacterium]
MKNVLTNILKLGIIITHTIIDKNQISDCYSTGSSTGIDACREAVQQGSSVKQEENAVCPGGING